MMIMATFYRVVFQESQMHVPIPKGDFEVVRGPTGRKMMTGKDTPMTFRVNFKGQRRVFLFATIHAIDLLENKGEWIAYGRVVNRLGKPAGLSVKIHYNAFYRTGKVTISDS